MILGGVGAALAQLFFLFALGWLAVRSWRRRPSEAMAQASLVAAALAALYLWLVLWLATPGPVILALAFLFTGLWLGLATGLGQVSLGEWPISWRRTSRAILTATLLALTLGAIWLALVAGRSAAAWWRYQALLTRWFQNPAATAELWPAAERLAADYFSPAFDRAAVDLTLTELRQLSRRQGSPAELEQQFAAAARAAIEAQAGKTYSISVTTEQKLKEAAEAARKALHDDLNKVKEAVKAAHEAVRKAAVALAQIPRVDEDAATTTPGN